MKMLRRDVTLHAFAELIISDTPIHAPRQQRPTDEWYFGDLLRMTLALRLPSNW